MADQLEGNGNRLIVHSVEIQAIQKSLEEIQADLKVALPAIAVHEQRLNGLDKWATWASGIGGSGLLALIIGFVAHILGGPR